jgi:hypothetical protein
MFIALIFSYKFNRSQEDSYRGPENYRYLSVGDHSFSIFHAVNILVSTSFLRMGPFEDQITSKRTLSQKMCYNQCCGSGNQPIFFFTLAGYKNGRILRPDTLLV